MQPPIPGVPKNAPVSYSKPAFFGLNIVILIEILLLVATQLLGGVFVRHNPDVHNSGITIAPKIEMNLYFPFLFFLWRGFNWARWAFIFIGIVMFAGMIALVSSPEFDKSPSLFPEAHRISIVAKCVWSAFMGIWLLLPGVARHFKSSPDASINH